MISASQNSTDNFRKLHNPRSLSKTSFQASIMLEHASKEWISWSEDLEKSKNARILAKPCLSKNRSFLDKAMILLAMPLPACGDILDMRWLETKLDEGGFVVVDIEARWIVQREISVQEEVRALYKSLQLNGG